MRNLALFTIALSLSASLAFAQQPASPSRSSVVVGTVKADESANIEVVRGNMQNQLNKFISDQQVIITQVNAAINLSSLQFQNLCALLYQTISIMPGVTITVPISVPAPGVHLTPAQVLAFCNSVLAIRVPQVTATPPTTTPFTTANVPPSCNPQTQDLAWTGTQWQCVTTMPAICNAPGTMPPAWVAN